MGYPLITLKKSDLTVSQQRFLIGGNGTGDSKYISPYGYVSFLHTLHAVY